MSKEDILLRSETNAPLTTKGSEFTYKNLDDNFIEVYNQLVSLSQSSNVDAYDNAITYSQDEYVQHSSQLWRMVNATPQINITPGTDAAVWSKVYGTDLVQAPNGIKTFLKVITVSNVLTMNATPIELIPAPGADKIIQVLSGLVAVDFDESSPGGSPYTTNGSIYIGNEGMDFASDKRMFDIASILFAEKKQAIPFTPYLIPYSATEDYLQINKSVVATVKTGNPGGGAGQYSNIIIAGTYRIL